MSEEEEAAVAQLGAALDGFGAALAACAAAGLPPAAALRAAGISLPAWAAPVLNRLEISSLLGLQSEQEPVSSV